MRYEVKYSTFAKKFLVINQDSGICQSAWNTRLEAVDCRNLLNHVKVAGRTVKAKGLKLVCVN